MGLNPKGETYKEMSAYDEGLPPMMSSSRCPLLQQVHRELSVLPGHEQGSVRARASKYNLCSRTGGNVLSRSFQDGQHGHGAAEELESAAIGGNVLVGAGARAEEVAQSIVSATESGGRSGAFEAPHGPVAAFDAAVILLQPVIQVGTGPVPHILAQLGADRPRIAVVAVGRDPIRCHPRSPLWRTGRPPERLPCRGAR